MDDDSAGITARRVESVVGEDDFSRHKQVWFVVTLVVIAATALARAAQHFFRAGVGVVRFAQQDGVVTVALRTQQQSRIAHAGMVIPTVSKTAMTREPHAIGLFTPESIHQQKFI